MCEWEAILKFFEAGDMVLKKFNCGCYAKNARDDDGLDQWVVLEEDGEKWSDLRYLLKIQPVWFADGLKVGYKRKTRVKSDSSIYGLSN